MPPTAHRASNAGRVRHILLLAALIGAGLGGAGALDAAGAQLSAYVLEPEGTTDKSATVDIIDLRTHAVTQVALGGDTFAGAVSANNSFFLVRTFTDPDNDTSPTFALAVVDTAQQALRSSLPRPSNGGVAIAPVGPVAYLTECTPGGVVTLVNFLSGEILGEIPLDVNPQNIWLSPSGAMAYVTDGGHCPGAGMTDDSVAAVDIAARREVARIPIGGVPRVVAISPNGDTAYVTKTTRLVQTGVAVVDTATNAVKGDIAIANPGQMAVAPDGARLYVISYPNDAAANIAVVDTGTLKVLRAIALRQSDTPVGVAIRPGGRSMYVTYRTDAGESYIAEIDTASDETIDSIPIPYAGNLALVNTCPADCDFDGQVTVGDMIKSVNIAAGRESLSTCPTADGNGDGRVMPDELVQLLQTALNGCPVPPPVTPPASAPDER